MNQIQDKKIFESRDIFEKALYNTPNIRKKIQLIQQAAINKKVELLPCLVKIIGQERHNYIIATLVKAIGYLGDERIIPLLENYLSFRDPRIRANTVEGLEYVGSKKIVPVVVKCLNDPDNRVKANAIKCLNKFGSVEVKKNIEEMLSDSRQESTYSAIFALKVMGNDYAVERIMKILRENYNSNVRYRAKNTILSLAELGNETAKKIVKEDPIFQDELLFENIRDLKEKERFNGRNIQWVGEVNSKGNGVYLLKDVLCRNKFSILYRKELLPGEIIEVHGKIDFFIDNEMPVIIPNKIVHLL